MQQNPVENVIIINLIEKFLILDIFFLLVFLTSLFNQYPSNNGGRPPYYGGSGIYPGYNPGGYNPGGYNPGGYNPGYNPVYPGGGGFPQGYPSAYPGVGYPGQGNYPGTNILGGNGGYGGFGGNGGLPTYFGYNSNNYYGNRNLGLGYYKDTSPTGLSQTDNGSTGRRGYD